MSGQQWVGRVVISFGLIAWLAGTAWAQGIAANRNDGGLASRRLAEADRRYAQQSYAKALALYQNALKAGEVPAARRDEVAYRIVVALGKTRRWDSALPAGLDFVRQRQGTVWEPRGLYWLGRLYLAVPHQGYRVGSRLYRGQDVPKTEDDTAPEAVNAADQDQQNARDALEAACVLYPRFRATDRIASEEIQLDFDLARVLAMRLDLRIWARKQLWLPPADPAWNIDSAADYDPHWPPPKKALFLYAQIRLLARGDRHMQALALLGEALWRRQYQALMRAYAVKYEREKLVHIPYPYQDLQAEPLLQQLVRDDPGDSVRDQAQYLLGVMQAQDGAFDPALSTFRQLILAHPKSKWAEDARAQQAAIRREQLMLDVPGRQLPGRAAHVEVASRNLRQVRLAVYRVEPARIAADSSHLRDPNRSLTNLADLFGDLKRARRLFGPQIAVQTLTQAKSADHQWHSETVTLPVKAAGAYVVVASVPNLRTAALLLVSDLVLVQKLGRDGALCYTADARSGRPIAGVKILEKQWWNKGDKDHAELMRAVTGSDGTVTVPLRRGPGRSNFRIAALAIKASRCAMTDQLDLNDSGDNPAAIKVYSTTDRAVYRPGQLVRYRQLVMRRARGDFKPVVNRQARIEVTDPQGKVVYKRREMTDAFGSISGQFPLASGAALGEYTIDVTLPKEEQGETEPGGNRFRVEEYKKPEFEVTVAPTAQRVRLGQPASAKVSATYYFGGPVPNARVTYRVYRSPYAQQYRFPQPFDFLYNYDSSGDYDTDYRNGEVVTQGTARTDAKGEAVISFATAADSLRWQDMDLTYTVEADVQDATRRVISGSGAVKATRKDVAVFLNFAHGYATQGDRLDVEVRSLNPSDQPVSVMGAAKVYRQPTDPKGKERLIYSQPLATDAQGRAGIQWTASRAGYYRVAFETRDTANQPVSGDTYVWVDGPELRQHRFLFQSVFLAVKNPYYQQGQAARVLLVTPEPGCTVLLTREADNQILDRRVVRVPGLSLELNVPLSQRDVPNVYLAAVMVRNGQMFQATQELFVPPVRQFAQVTVRADRARYQPGERAKLTLQARDYLNRPLRTELCVSISDAALNYIQKDYAPDIRAYFYGGRRSQSIENGGSIDVHSEPETEDTQPKQAFQQHEFLLPDGMGRLVDWPGIERGDIDGRFNGIDSGFSMAMGGRGTFGVGPAGPQGPPMGMAGGFIPPARNVYDEVVPKAVQSRPLALGIAGEDAFNVPWNQRAARRWVWPQSVYISGDTLIGSDNYIGLADRIGSLAEATVRRKFLDTAFWTPAVVTDAQGSATVEVIWPDNLTQWRAVAVGSTTGAQVGAGETRVTTRKDLLVQLEAPRFAVEKDTITLSANVHNDTDGPAHVRVKLDLGSDAAEIVERERGSGGEGEKKASSSAQPLPLSTDREKSEGSDNSAQVSPSPLLPFSPSAVWIDIGKGEEKRVDWVVRARHEGLLRVRMTAQSAQAADAAETVVPILIHGVERATAQGGVLRDQTRAELTIHLPQERKPGSSELIVQFNPSLAAVMLDALPYLADYPYGCVEQTMSRFLPCVVVASTLKDLGYDLHALRQQARLLQQRAQQDRSRSVQPDSPYTSPQGKPDLLRNAYTDLTSRCNSPVFNPKELDGMVSDGLLRLEKMQHADGGWGWWPDDESDPQMSAYVLYGLQIAHHAGYVVNNGMIRRGMDYLRARFLQDADIQRMAQEARVLALDPHSRRAIAPLVTGRLYSRRERLSPYGRALLALALNAIGDRAKAQILLDNLEDTAHIDADNGTADWDDIDHCWWRWYNNKVETNATILQAYMAIRPGSKLPPLLVKWLVNNRRGDAWSDTHDTALAVSALADYGRAGRELAPDYTLTVDLGGRIRRTYHVTHHNALFFDNRFVVPDALLQSGDQALTITRQGKGVCYYSAYTRTFSQQDPIPSSGNEIFVERRYYRLVPGTATGAPQPEPLPENRPNPFLTGDYSLLNMGGIWFDAEDTDQGPRYTRVALQPGEMVQSGDLLEVELQLEAKNDYDYVTLQDVKPAGCEPVELRSGAHAGRGVYSNMELRDEAVAFFISHLPQGRRVLTYRLRAEQPGQFHVLPTNGYAMYAPDIRTLSTEQELKVSGQ